MYETFADTDGDFEDQVAAALDVGSRYLDPPIGFLTRIDDGTQEIVQSIGDHDLIQRGETCLLEDAYCRRTVEVDGSLAVKNASQSPDVAASAVETFDLGTYVGARIDVDDEVYGTVCFADGAHRETPFSESEEVFIELLAKLLGQALERRAYERELQRQNRRLMEEKRRFQGIAENSFDILFRLGGDASFTYVSSAVERILGYDPADLEGSPFAEFVTKESVPVGMDAYATVVEGESVENLELEFLHADGAPVVIEVNATPITEGEEVVGVQGVGRDVTDRKERERELRMKTRAMDEADIGISIADNRRPDAPLVYVNEGFERVTGYDETEAVGRNCRFLQGPETDPDSVTQFRESVDAAEPTTVEILNYRSNGTPFWNQVRISPVEDESGEVAHFLGFQADVTERKRTERLIQLLNRVLRHNLRNDLTAMLGFGDMLSEADGEVAAYGERVVETAESLVDLSEQARRLERAARRNRDLRRLSPEALLGGVADDFRDRYARARIDLAVETDREVVAGLELDQAVSELVENAVAHNPSSDPWVGIEATTDGDWVEIRIADDGPGIDGMESSVISKGEETDLEHGSGLGLWLVNWIVTRYGGSFQIGERDGAETGSVATVRLRGVAPGVDAADVDLRPTVLFR